MELAADGAGDLGHTPLDRHVNVLVLGMELEPLGGHLVPDLARARCSSAGDVVSLDDPLPPEHADVGERLLDVVRREAPVERDRAVQRLEGRVLRL